MERVRLWVSQHICDPNDPNATIKIIKINGSNTNEWHEFVFPKWQLSARKTIVLGFGIEPLAHKSFTLLNVNEGDAQNGALINYEIVLECNIRQSPRYENYVIGSEFYQHSAGGGPNFMFTVKLYDIMAHSCYGDGHGNENSIEIVIIKNNRHLRPTSTFDDTMKGFMENLTQSEAEDASQLRCLKCKENVRRAVFYPCKHVSVCGHCADEIMNSREAGENQCPICRAKIDKAVPFILS
ncbi:hypothetical protein niasHT_028894 [Heterodera trifolii]|uniref:RING-type domain-containing protein n=1 Tax=Heterodera trifolii TaxID=157864 RepID=A0ABD2KLF3_9BILA